MHRLRPQNFGPNSNTKPQLYWGFIQKRTRYGSYQLAEPEKALLDSVYLALQDGIEPALDDGR